LKEEKKVKRKRSKYSKTSL